MSTASPDFVFALLLDGKGGATELEDIDGWRPEQGSIWLHLDLGDAAGCQWLQARDDVPIAAIDSLLAADTRPHSHVFQDGMLVVLRGINLNPGANPEDMVSIRIWIDGARIISTRHRRLLSAQDVGAALRKGTGPANTSEFLPALVERLADRTGDFVDAIEEDLDDTEEDAATADVAAVRGSLAALRRQVASVRRFLAPQRDALDRLTRMPLKWLAESDVFELRQEADRITRYLEDLEFVRERAIVLQEELLGRVAEAQSSRMYVLSVVAAIFLPLSFITGLLGMNVGGLPGVASDQGFFWSAIVMITAAIGLISFFRWKKWL